MLFITKVLYRNVEKNKSKFCDVILQMNLIVQCKKNKRLRTKRQDRTLLLEIDGKSGAFFFVSPQSIMDKHGISDIF